MAVIRILPAGLAAVHLAPSSASISSNRWPRLWRRRSPAPVGETVRVVRVSSLRPNRSSSPRIVWLSAD
jgi:hypothetical protein